MYFILPLLVSLYNPAHKWHTTTWGFRLLPAELPVNTPEHSPEHCDRRIKLSLVCTFWRQYRCVCNAEAPKLLPAGWWWSTTSLLIWRPTSRTWCFRWLLKEHNDLCWWLTLVQRLNNLGITGTCYWSAVSKMLHLCVPLFPFQHHLCWLIRAKALHCKGLPFTGIHEMFFTTHLWIQLRHRAAKPTLIITTNNTCFNLWTVIALLLTTQGTSILRGKKPSKIYCEKPTDWVCCLALSEKYEKNPCIQKCVLNYHDLLQIASEYSNLWVCRILQSTLLLKASFFMQSFAYSFAALFFMDFPNANFCQLCYNLLRVWVVSDRRDARDVQEIISGRNQR